MREAALTRLMTDIQKYRAKAAKKPLQFWLQPFVLLLFIVLLWRLLPFSALMYKPRVMQPLPAPHVFYVNLDSVFASEVLRTSMQTWRRTEFGGGGDAISFEEIDPFEPLGPPQLLEQGSVYPGRWTPGDVTPLAQSLPDLLYTSRRATLFPFDVVEEKGLRVSLSPALKKAEFDFPEKELADLKGSGSARYCIETDAKGSVVHVLSLNPEIETSVLIERLLYRGNSKDAVRGELQIMWRKP